MTSLLPWLIDAALKSTALLVIVFGLTLTLRRASAAVRHLVWGLGVAGALALPLVSAMLPWRLAVLPSRPLARAVPAETLTPSISQTFGTAPVPEFAVEPEPASAPARAPASSMVESGSPPPEGEAGPQWQLPGTVPLLVGLWMAGAVLALGHLGLGVLSAARLTRRSTPLGQVGPWGQLLHQLKAQLGVRLPVRLLLSDRASLPATWGLTRPVIVLPHDALGWSEERRRAVLLHELAHIARSDLLLHLVAEVACSVYWFNPMMWIASRRLRAESERACDDLVLDHGIRPSDYAVQLLQIVRSVGRERAPAIALPLAQRSEFEGRLLAILEPGLERRGITRGTAMLFAGAIGALALPLAALSPAGEVPATPAGEEQQQQAAQGPQQAKPQAPQPRQKLPDKQKVPIDLVMEPKFALVDPMIQVDLDPVLWMPDIDIDLGNFDSPVLAEFSLLKGPRGQSATSQAVAPLIATLSDSDAGVRAAAVRALGELQDASAVAALGQALQNDADPNVREMAAWALGQIEDRAAVPALGNALRNDREASVRKQAAWALGQIDDASAADALGAALRDQNLEVRRMVVWALGQIEDARSVAPLAQVLRTDADAQLRERAAWALGQIDDAGGVEALSAALRQDAEVRVRKQAAWALGQIEDVRGVEALGVALRDANIEVRRMAVWAMGQIEDPRTAAALLPGLQDADVEVRRQTAWALGQVQSTAAVDGLIAALRDADAKVRSMAAWALGEIGDPRAANGLATALKDESPEVRKNAAWALGELKNLRTVPPQLLEALADSDRNVRIAAARAAGEIQDPAAAAALGRLAQDADAQVRQVAVRGLSEIASEASIEILVGLLKHEDPEVRRTAARALGQRR